MPLKNKDKSLSQQRKLNRKLTKYQQLLTKEADIAVSTEPTKTLIICNAGLVNGLMEETIYEHFSIHGTLSGIWMIPGKSFCFISYEELESSVLAYETFNGQLNIAQDCKPIYLLYIEQVSVPSQENCWKSVPPGLIIIEDFVDNLQEEQLLALCKFESGTSSSMKHRLVKHFGYEFRYDINNVDKDKPLPANLPDETQFLWTKLAETHMQFARFKPDQLTINHYLPGQGIPHHIDTHSAFEDPIVCLSLGSSLVMEFKKDNQHLNVLLPQRSLLIMSEESRYSWTHGIVPRKFDVIKTNSGFTCCKRNTRVSFTFRKVLKGECECLFKSKCDSASKKSVLIKDDVASQLEELHVHNVYNVIADHFSDTRHKPWPNVLQFVQSLNAGDILVDVGCGNGKYLANNPNIYDIGCDRSIGLIDICRNRNFEAFIADCLYIPLKDNTADAVISIAVLHHLATENRRLKALKEITRVLKVGGKALIYVWANNQVSNQEKSAYIKQDRKNRKGPIESKQTSEKSVPLKTGKVSLPVHTNRSNFQANDVLVPWKLKDVNKTTFLRFYHVFEENELENLCRQVGNIDVVKSYYDQGNWCILLQKK